MSQERTTKEGAEQARKAGREIADLVYEKQLAYGDASGIQHAIWKALLRQYEAGGVDILGSVKASAGIADADDLYIIPRALMDHIPRLTRVFDRICRIVSNPAADRMGEDPWRDLAGDALCGIVMPRTQAAKRLGPEGDTRNPAEVEAALVREFDALFGEGSLDTLRQSRAAIAERLPAAPIGNDDPFEDYPPVKPHRVWAEPTLTEEEQATAAEQAQRRKDRAEQDARLAEHMARRNDRLATADDII